MDESNHKRALRGEEMLLCDEMGRYDLMSDGEAKLRRAALGMVLQCTCGSGLQSTKHPS